MKRNGRTMVMGIIGAGMVAELHLDTLIKLKSVNLKWLCDVSEKNLRAGQKKYRIPNGTGDYRDVLGDPEVDAVLIGTPPVLHGPMTVDAIRKGKHVLLEKPLAINRREMNRMIRQGRTCPRIRICECSCRHSRLQPKFAYVKKIVDSGRLGQVYFIHHNSVQRHIRPGIEYNPNAKWFLDKNIAGGGPLLDWGVYDLSFHLGILGDRPQLKSVRAFTINGLDKVGHGAPAFTVEEHGAALMEFDTGLRYYYERSSNAHNSAPNETRIYGTRGGMKLSYLSWDSPEIDIFYVDDNGRGKAKKKTLRVDMRGHDDDFTALDRHFVGVVLGKEKPAMPLELAAKHLDIIFRIYRAASAGLR